MSLRSLPKGFLIGRGTGCQLAWQMPRCGTGPTDASSAAMQPSTKVRPLYCLDHGLLMLHCTKLHKTQPVGMHTHLMPCCRSCYGREGQGNPSERSAKHFRQEVVATIHSRYLRTLVILTVMSCTYVADYWLDNNLLCHAGITKKSMNCCPQNSPSLCGTWRKVLALHWRPSASRVLSLRFCL
jgi:hypothetical protein